MSTTPADLLALVDAYARAAEARSEARDGAGWAYLAAHRDMLAARAAVAEVLEVTAPPLEDDLTRLADDAAVYDRAWRDRIDAALAGSIR